MKKFAFLLVAALCCLNATATTYTGQLSVTINGEGDSQDDVTIAIEKNADGTYDLSLNNFCLVSEDSNIAVGNILVNNVEATTGKRFTNLFVNREIEITEGDLEDVDLWIGPFLGELPINLNATFDEQTMSVHIDIDMSDPESLGQFIKVDFLSAPVKGDVNNDGDIDVSDINGVVSIMLN